MVNLPSNSLTKKNSNSQAKNDNLKTNFFHFIFQSSIRAVVCIIFVISKSLQQKEKGKTCVHLLISLLPNFKQICYFIYCAVSFFPIIRAITQPFVQENRKRKKKNTTKSFNVIYCHHTFFVNALIERNNINAS